MSKCPWARYWTPHCCDGRAIGVWMPVFEFLKSRLALCREASLLLVCEWVNADLCCNGALSSWKTRKVRYKYSQLDFLFLTKFFHLFLWFFSQFVVVVVFNFVCLFVYNVPMYQKRKRRHPLDMSTVILLRSTDFNVSDTGRNITWHKAMNPFLHALQYNKIDDVM